MFVSWKLTLGHKEILNFVHLCTMRINTVYRSIFKTFNIYFNISECNEKMYAYSVSQILINIIHK